MSIKNLLFMHTPAHRWFCRVGAQCLVFVLRWVLGVFEVELGRFNIVAGCRVRFVKGKREERGRRKWVDLVLPEGF